MKEAVIVSTARTPIGKAFRGAFNDTEAPQLGGHVVREAVRRAGIEPGEVDDVIIGAAAQQGTSPTTSDACVRLPRACRPRLLAWPWSASVRLA